MKEIFFQNEKDFCHAPLIFKLEVNNFLQKKSLEQTKKMDSCLQVNFS